MPQTTLTQPTQTPINNTPVKGVIYIPYKVLSRLDAKEKADLRFDIQERAAIMEYDGGLPRAEAERLAVECAIRKFK
jgi:hypothetical protein